MSRLEIRPATLEDLPVFAAALRPENVEEILRFSGREPLPALRDAFPKGKKNRKILPVPKRCWSA